VDIYWACHLNRSTIRFFPRRVVACRTCREKRPNENHNRLCVALYTVGDKWMSALEEANDQVHISLNPNRIWAMRRPPLFDHPLVERYLFKKSFIYRVIKKFVRVFQINKKI
jgi:hypothetical protein